MDILYFLAGLFSGISVVAFFLGKKLYHYYIINKIQKTTNILGEISIWRSVGMLGLSSLGDTVFSQSSNTKLRTYMAGFGSTHPKSFKKLMYLEE